MVAAGAGATAADGEPKIYADLGEVVTMFDAVPPNVIGCCVTAGNVAN